ncbi:sarcosine oxidase subunit alpha, partial [Mesorhizobium sp. M7A.F.Ca.ET.027.03.2.1]
AETGVRVILADEQAEFGGSLRFESGAKIDGQDGFAWAQAAVAKLAAMDNVRVLSRTTAFGYYAQNFVGLVERVSEHLRTPGHDLARERLWQVRAKRVVLASGEIERHMVFADNDRPGIMLAGAARTYLNHYGVAVGRNVGVYTANDSAYAAAIDLKKAGVNVAAIVDLRENPTGPVIDEARALGIEINFGRAVIRAGGKLRVSSMTVQPKNGGGERTIAVDAILMSAGWTPSVHLFSQSRGKVAFNDETKRFVPGTYAQDCVSVGACNGTDGLSATVDEAYAAGAKAAKDAGAKAAKSSKPKVDASESWSRGMLGAAPGAGPDTTVKAFVDFQNDVTAKDIRQAVHEGMRSIEHVKRFTTNGMATDQGKTSNMHGLAIAAETLGKPIPEVGLTTFRAPYTPVTFGAIVSHARGPLFDPTRRTAIHPWA